MCVHGQAPRERASGLLGQERAEEREVEAVGPHGQRHGIGGAAALEPHALGGIGRRECEAPGERAVDGEVAVPPVRRRRVEPQARTGPGDLGGQSSQDLAVALAQEDPHLPRELGGGGRARKGEQSVHPAGQRRDTDLLEVVELEIPDRQDEMAGAMAIEGAVDRDAAIGRRETQVIHMHRPGLGHDGHRPGESPGAPAFLQIESREPDPHRVPPRGAGECESEFDVAVAERGIALEGDDRIVASGEARLLDRDLAHRAAFEPEIGDRAAAAGGIHRGGGAHHEVLREIAAVEEAPGLRAAPHPPAVGGAIHGHGETGRIDRDRIQPGQLRQRGEIPSPASDAQRVAAAVAAEREPAGAVERRDVGPEDQRVERQLAGGRHQGEVELLDSNLPHPAGSGDGTADTRDTGAVGHGLEPELGLHSAVRSAVSRPAREMLHTQGAVGPDPGLLAQGSGEPCHDLGILTLGAQLPRQHPALDAQVGPAAREPGLVDGGGQQVQAGSCPQTVSGAGSDRGREPRVDRGREIGAVQPRAQIEGFDAAAADVIFGRIRHGRAVPRDRERPATGAEREIVGQSFAFELAQERPAGDLDLSHPRSGHLGAELHCPIGRPPSAAAARGQAEGTGELRPPHERAQVHGIEGGARDREGRDRVEGPA